MKSPNTILFTLSLVLAVFLTTPQASASLLANDDFDSVEDEVNSLMERFDNESLVELSNRLVKMAHEEELDRDYYNAIKHYRQGLRIRERLNLHSTKSYANILLLTSMTEHSFGASCDAKEHAEKAKNLYLKLNHEKEAKMADDGIHQYKNACLVMVVNG
ncbi:MAG: hypothetical protein MH321_16265 [Leptospiraceae bacterium]|nr:hypothetical protein [Leptospiraceae bacterium]